MEILSIIFAILLILGLSFFLFTQVRNLLLDIKANRQKQLDVDKERNNDKGDK